jgi:hypothetical protein
MPGIWIVFVYLDNTVHRLEHEWPSHNLYCGGLQYNNLYQRWRNSSVTVGYLIYKQNT